MSPSGGRSGWMRVLGAGVPATSNVDRVVQPRGDGFLELRAGEVAPGQPAGFAGLVEQHGARHRFRRAQVAKSCQRHVVPQQPVSAARHQHRDDDADVVLPEIEVVTLDVHEAELLLAEAVEGFRRAREPLLAHVERALALHLRGAEAARRLGENRPAGGVEEPDGARGARDAHPQRGRSHRHRLRRRGNRPRGAAAALRRGDQRRAVEERAVRCIRDPDDVVGADLDLQRRAWVARRACRPRLSRQFPVRRSMGRKRERAET